MVVIRFRRDVAFRWTAMNPILFDGEPGFERDTGKIKIGNGVLPWRELEYTNPGISDPPGFSSFVYVHFQEMASATWDVVHNLGGFPNATLVDMFDRKFIAEINYINDDRLQVVLTTPVSGKAYVS